jgi:hypothetical protein
MLGNKPPISSYPWFEGETTSGSKTFIKFKHFHDGNNYYSVSVPATELAGKVIVELSSNGEIDSVQFGPDFKDRATFFHTNIGKDEDIPDFVVLRCVQSGCTKHKTDGRGKRAAHNYVVCGVDVARKGASEQLTRMTSIHAVLQPTSVV